MHILFLIAAAAPAPAPIPAPATQPSDAIVVTAARLPVAGEEAPASVSVFDAAEIEALGEPFALDYLRLSPGASVSVSGAEGSQAQIRIRGAEANQTLLFVDGIAFNDVASDNQARFETFAADGLERIEVIRGPQSALWGSEAMGGVIALETPAPLAGRRGSGLVELGSRDSRRATAAFALGGSQGGVAGTAAWSRSDGIDIFGGGEGDPDGYESRSLSLKGVLRPLADVELGVVGRAIRHDNDYDGTENFVRADTLDASEAETYAGRVWAQAGLGEDAPWSVKAEAQHLDNQNRNFDGAAHVNDSFGRRTRFGAQAVRRFAPGAARHALIAAVEREDEDFATRDRRFGGGSDVDHSRGRTALVGEWRAEWSPRVTTDIAVRHDDFNRFEDETTIRAAATVEVAEGLSLFAAYGEGIAQPGFAELFGFAPNSGFVGNAELTPERSKGYEAGLRWRGRTASAELAAFSNDLTDEIVYEQLTPFPALTYRYVNSDGKSRRRGIEASAEWRPAAGLSVAANYSFLDAREPDVGAGEPPRETRRPRHSANLFATWTAERFSLAGSASYVGPRRDIDFDRFEEARLDDYVLIGARAAYALTPQLELYGRIENGLGADYQDVFGYNTPGRSVYAGLRVRLGR
jgi:vitamin B12 transporter